MGQRRQCDLDGGGAFRNTGGGDLGVEIRGRVREYLYAIGGGDMKHTTRSVAMRFGLAMWRWRRWHGQRRAGLRLEQGLG
jgi:hypothetical protein